MTPSDDIPSATSEGSGRVLAGVYGVSKWFGGVHAVRDVSLEIRAGEVHCLIGENGAGKSTVVKMLAGVHRPDRGRVVVAGKEVSLGSPSAALKAGVSTVFQELALVPDMTVAENMWLGNEPRGPLGLISRRRRNTETAEVLDDLGIDGIRPKDRIRDLGVARQQLIEIARAVSKDGEQVVIMDEPTAALSTRETETLFTLIRRLRQRKVGILYITHRLEEIPIIADVVTVMRDREVRSAHRAQDVERATLIEEMIGRKLEDLYPREGRSAGEVGFEIDHPELGIPIRARRGEVTAIFGLVGAGRTELIRSAIGADPRPSGMRVQMDGSDVRFSSPGRAMKSGVTLIPEDRKAQGIVPEMSVASNVALSTLSNRPQFALTSQRRLNGTSRGLIEDLQIKTPSMHQKIALLSGGNQQKALVARAIACSPTLVIFDEPTRGVDVGARVEVYGLINKLCAEGKTVLVISSDLPEALGLSDALFVMREGRVSGLVNPRETDERGVMDLAVA